MTNEPEPRPPRSEYLRRVLEAAHQYVELGLQLLPVEGKTPYWMRWPMRATSDIDKIADFLNDERCTGMAVATGPRSGIWVIDEDMDDPHERATEALDLPDCPTVSTPSGGRHYYFEWDVAHPVGTATRVLAGVDVRGAGGLAVLPPTIGSDGQYTWELDLESNPLEKAPETLAVQFEELTRPRGRRRGQVQQANCESVYGGVRAQFCLPDVICEGERNDVLFRFACSLWSKRQHPDEIMELVLDANRELCRPPLDEAEAKQLVRSALNRYSRGTGSRTSVVPLRGRQRHGRALRSATNRARHAEQRARLEDEWAEQSRQKQEERKARKEANRRAWRSRTELEEVPPLETVRGRVRARSKDQNKDGEEGLC